MESQPNNQNCGYFNAIKILLSAITGPLALLSIKHWYLKHPGLSRPYTTNHMLSFNHRPRHALLPLNPIQQTTLRKLVLPAEITIGPLALDPSMTPRPFVPPPQPSCEFASRPSPVNAEPLTAS